MFFRILALGAFFCMTGTVLAADPVDEVNDAAKKLADTGNYSWRSVTNDASNSLTVVVDGQTQEDGSTLIKLTGGGSYAQIALRGRNSVLNVGGGWQTADEAADQPQAARFMSSVMSPALVASQIASRLDDLKPQGNVFTAQLSGGEVSNLLRPLYSLDAIRTRGMNNAGAKASIKFWIKDGLLEKFQVHITGTSSRGGADTAVDRTVTVDFRDVGKTKVSLPEQAKKKLE